MLTPTHYLTISAIAIALLYMLYCLREIMLTRQAQTDIETAPYINPLKFIPKVSKDRDQRSFAHQLLQAQLTFVHLSVIFCIVEIIISITILLLLHA